MTEMNKRACRKCKVERDRILVGKYPNNKDKKWQGESGKLWNGNVCDICNNKRAKLVMRRIRAKRNKSAFTQN